MLAVALLYGRVDPLVASSGVYRTGALKKADEERVRFMADGKTATVSIIEAFDGEHLVIATNGKPDAGLAAHFAKPAGADEVTMIMAAALPLAMHPAPSEVAAIGWGSGLTTHTLLGSPVVRRVETVEIEPVMVRGARAFGPRVERAYLDPRSEIVYDDARTYFSAGRKQYDVLISEPSNPWVSGVASLFTEEFYGFASRHLKPGGLFVQWLQSYELSDALQARIIAALLNRFEHVDAYLTNGADLLLVASASPLPPLDWQRLNHPALGQEVRRVALVDANAFAVRRLGGREVLSAYVRMNHAEASHSDYRPDVALNAPRDRFTDEFAGLLPLLAQNGLPVLDLIDGRRVPRQSELAPWEFLSSIVDFQRVAAEVNASLTDPAALQRLKQKQRMAMQALAVERVLSMSAVPIAPGTVPEWSRQLAVLGHYGPGALAADELADSWAAPKWLAPGQGPAVSAVMAAYRAAALRDAAAMRTAGNAALALDAGLDVDLRQQLLVIAMAGAAGERDMAAVRALDAKYGGAMPRDDDMAQVRRFLVAWAGSAAAP